MLQGWNVKAALEERIGWLTFSRPAKRLDRFWWKSNIVPSQQDIHLNWFCGRDLQSNVLLDHGERNEAKSKGSVKVFFKKSQRTCEQEFFFEMQKSWKFTWQCLSGKKGKKRVNMELQKREKRNNKFKRLPDEREREREKKSKIIIRNWRI